MVGSRWVGWVAGEGGLGVGGCIMWVVGECEL